MIIVCRNIGNSRSVADVENRVRQLQLHLLTTKDSESADDTTPVKTKRNRLSDITGVESNSKSDDNNFHAGSSSPDDLFKLLDSFSPNDDFELNLDIIGSNIDYSYANYTKSIQEVDAEVADATLNYKQSGFDSDKNVKTRRKLVKKSRLSLESNRTGTTVDDDSDLDIEDDVKQVKDYSNVNALEMKDIVDSEMQTTNKRNISLKRQIESDSDDEIANF